MEKMLITAVAKDTNVSRISIIGVADEPGIAFKVFSRLASKNINIDIILQSAGRDGTKDISFTVTRDNCDEATAVARQFIEEVSGNDIIVDNNVAKVSIVGAGMESHAGVAARMFEALYAASVNIQMIATSEIKISVLISEDKADKAVSAIHDAFFN